MAPEFLAQVGALADSSPSEHGWERSTWRLKLFGLEFERQKQRRVHRSTIARHLNGRRVAFSRARQHLVSPEPDTAAQLAKVESLEVELGTNDSPFHVDEVDVHLNPTIESQCRPNGVQPHLGPTDNNRRAYFAGALDYGTCELAR